MITITVSGPQGSGKSKLIFAIAGLCRHLGIVCRVESEVLGNHALTEEEWATFVREKDMFVTINEEQTK